MIEKSDLGVTRCGRMTSAVWDRFPGVRSSASMDGDSEVAGFGGGREAQLAVVRCEKRTNSYRGGFTAISSRRRSQPLRFHRIFG